MPPVLELDSVTTPPGARSSTLWRHPAVVSLLLAVALFAPLCHLHYIDQGMPSSHSDLVDDWVGVRDAYRGMDPYSLPVTHDIQMVYYGRLITPADNVPDQAFPYPAYLIVPFAPLAPLSWPAVRLTFLIVMIPGTLLGVWAVIRFLNLELTRARVALVAFLTICSWPVMWALRLQQPTLVVAACLFCATLLFMRGRQIPAGLLMAVAMVKPQLALPLSCWFVAWSFLHRSWRFTISFAATMAFMLLFTERIVPHWFPHWIAALHRYGSSHGALPLELILGRWAGLIASSALAVWSCARLWEMRRCAAESKEFSYSATLILSLTLCFNLTFPPNIYIQIVLLPAGLLLFHTTAPKDRSGLFHRIALGLLTWTLVAAPIAVLGETLCGTSGFWGSLPFLNQLIAPIVTVAVVLLPLTAGKAVRSLAVEGALHG